MKKLLSLVLALAMMTVMFTACTDNGKTNDTDTDTTSEVVADDTVVRIAGMKGPTSMGLVKLLEDDSKEETKRYDFSMHATADEISPKLIKGELDMAAVPVNLASVLYNKTEGKIKLVAVNTLGVLYIVEKNSGVTNIADLKGKTIYATGKGSTPEYNLRYILKENGIDPEKDVTIEWKSEATEIVSALKGADSGVAMLPQPYATVASTQVEGLNTAINLTTEWEKLDNGSKLITGVIVARSEFLEAHPTVVEEFLKNYESSINYAAADTNIEEVSALIEKYDIVKAAIAKKALPKCNLEFIAGEDMKTAVEGYLNILHTSNPSSVGGKMPADDFYYTK